MFGRDRVFRRQALARELTVVLLVKLAALALIWLAFFRGDPAADPGRLVVPLAALHQENPR